MDRTRQLVLATGLSVVAFAGGFLTGRMFPTHHYEKFGSGPYVLDSSTGKICDPRPVPNRTVFDELVQPVDKPVPYCQK